MIKFICLIKIFWPVVFVFSNYVLFDTQPYYVTRRPNYIFVTHVRAPLRVAPFMISDFI